MTERNGCFYKPKRDLEFVIQRPDRIQFDSTEPLDKLNKQFTQSFPRWDNLISQYRHIKHDIDVARKQKGKDEKYFCHEELTSLFSEMHLRTYLENNGHVQSEIIPNGATTPNFLFERSIDGRLHVYHRARTKEFCEYDALAYYDDLPVLYEVKMCSFIRNGANEKIESAMKRSHAENIFKPLAEFFDTKQFGYSLIIPPEEIHTDSISQRRFLNEGGMISGFCMNNRLFKSGITHIRQEYKI